MVVPILLGVVAFGVPTVTFLATRDKPRAGDEILVPPSKLAIQPGTPIPPSAVPPNVDFLIIKVTEPADANGRIKGMLTGGQGLPFLNPPLGPVYAMASDVLRTVRDGRVL